MNKIETLKKELKNAQNSGGDWETPYFNLLKEIYNCEVLFAALSKSDYDSNNHTSKPLVSTKDFDGTPSIYVFSDIEIATLWMRHYRHITDDMKYILIGALKKDFYDFKNLFQIAYALGITKVMLDEGIDYVGFDLEVFVEVNQIKIENIILPISMKDSGSIRENNCELEICFARVEAIPLASRN